MAWKSIVIHEKVFKQLESFKKQHKITYTEAIKQLLEKYDEENGESEAKTEAAEQPARTG